MNRNLLNNMFFGDLEDSDKELEFLTIACMEEERLNKEKQSRRHRGSVQGHRVIWRDIVQGHERLFQDYFAEMPVYPPILFWRRFRMQRSLFLRIQYTVEAHVPYFVQKTDALGMLADYVDEYVRIGESTAIESLKKFVRAVVVIFSDKYLRPPNNDDIARLLAVGEHHGFPGMLGSIDSMASYDLWIWHAFFGLLGSHNDINMLERSSVFIDLADGRAAAVNYSVNGNDYAMSYYLADGIYPQWSTFVKTIPSPQGNKQKYFTAAQESARKDVERAFGILQA
ncbi:hypothetical protein HHK36_024168 [Tetracentron sinense]|uniref:Uncharacterized protein n=1 Tax=Tetracentron sinense TaxID=13715 RepID=A0A834YIZ5_TETSI|nr:hypothetical protein HHK36_024168 [Tetracentron sinense]